MKVVDAGERPPVDVGDPRPADIPAKSYKVLMFTMNKEANRKFKLFSGKVSGDETRLPVSSIPKLGDEVFDSRGKAVCLSKELGSGGEGSVYEIASQHACKIYASDCFTQSTKNKLRLMIYNSITRPGICWPIDTIYNCNGEICGYYMNRGKGVPLQSIFTLPLLNAKFPHWNKSNLVELSLSILEAIKYLHDRNIILGDINPQNILVENEKSVYLIDTDSYQVGAFPCRVCNPTYLAPEYHGQNLSKFYRNFDAEHFAIATMLFMLFMNGQQPFAHVGGGDPGENVRKRHFPYPLKEYRGNGVPKGKWSYIWSHFSFHLKESFFITFQMDKRLSTNDWIAELKKYQYDLEKGYVSNELIPNHYKVPNRHAVQKYGLTPYTGKTNGQSFTHYNSSTNETHSNGKYYVSKPQTVKPTTLNRPVRPQAKQNSGINRKPATQVQHQPVQNPIHRQRVNSIRTHQSVSNPTTLWGFLINLFK